MKGGVHKKIRSESKEEITPKNNKLTKTTVNTLKNKRKKKLIQGRIIFFLQGTIAPGSPVEGGEDEDRTGIGCTRYQFCYGAFRDEAQGVRNDSPKQILQENTDGC